MVRQVSREGPLSLSVGKLEFLVFLSTDNYPGNHIPTAESNDISATPPKTMASTTLEKEVPSTTLAPELDPEQSLETGPAGPLSLAADDVDDPTDLVVVSFGFDHS